MSMVAWHHILLFLAQKGESEAPEAILTGAIVLDAGILTPFIQCCFHVRGNDAAAYLLIAA